MTLFSFFRMLHHVLLLWVRVTSAVLSVASAVVGAGGIATITKLIDSIEINQGKYCLLIFSFLFFSLLLLL